MADLFIYNADVWCPSCAAKIKRQLAEKTTDGLIAALSVSTLKREAMLVAHIRPSFRNDVIEIIIEHMDSVPETEYDSDFWPKSGTSEPTDSPQHCGSGAECEEAETLDEGAKIGALLGTELTEEGVRYLNEMLSSPEYPTPHQAQVHRFWRDKFSHYSLAQ